MYSDVADLMLLFSIAAGLIGMIVIVISQAVLFMLWRKLISFILYGI